MEHIDNNIVYGVQYVNDGSKGNVASYELASSNTPDRNKLKNGTRVIARHGENMPYKLDKTGQQIGLYQSHRTEFYAGIFVGFDDIEIRCLVFFDDGIVEYVPLKHIRCVLGNDGHQHCTYDLIKIDC